MTPTLAFDPLGFSVRINDARACRVDYANVRENVAFKEDVWSYDEICIGFSFDGENVTAVVRESYGGYNSLDEELKREFLNIRTNWFREVAFQAFVQNWTVIWKKPTNP